MIRIEVDTPEEKLHVMDLLYPHPCVVYTVEKNIDVYCDRFVQMKYSNSDEYLSRFDAEKQALRHDPDVVLIEK